MRPKLRPLRPTGPVALLSACMGAALVPGLLSAQDGPEYPTEEEIREAENAPLFTSHETLQLTLTADFHTIREDDRSDEDSQERPAVMEWVNPTYEPGEGEIRGGSWNTGIWTTRAANRVSAGPDGSYFDVGFRCAWDYAP